MADRRGPQTLGQDAEALEEETPQMTTETASRRDFLMLTTSIGLASGASAPVQAQVRDGPAGPIRQAPCALEPQQNLTRNLLELAGLWEFQLDPDGIGDGKDWATKLPAPRLIGVPGSWNDQFEDTRDYTGVAWYQTRTTLPRSWRGQRVVLRVGSAVYHATVWINGHKVGEHQGGHLPFAFDITALADWGHASTITIRVENVAMPTRVPPAGYAVPGHATNFPDINYDYFPYSGLHRAVTLYAVPKIHISDISAVTAFEGADGLVHLRVSASEGFSGAGSAAVGGAKTALSFKGGEATATLRIPAVQAWSPATPHLYPLTVTLGDAAEPTDVYTLEIGVRTIEVKGDQLLLNGQPIHLKGAARHEDFPINGRGLNLPVAVRDIQLLKWIGGNSFRTSHYPYAEETMRLADREGMLVINEIPACKLYFGDSDANIRARLDQCRQDFLELYTRDKNHPSVIMWCLANEPTSNAFVNNAGAKLPLDDAYKANGLAFFQALFGYARTLDKTRPFTLTAMSATEWSWADLSDVLCINRYNGWYSHLGDPGSDGALLGPELDALHARTGKPIMVTEFGADAIAGVHADPPEMWSEEYEAELVSGVVDACASRPFVAGTQVWMLCDIKTAQATGRAGGMNLKGVFTRDRRPKMAAHALRKRWAT
ncbi:MAG TPA: glycoside hydrolase family 2 TIM barrel-domain containing protein [Caulobacteraceae bacterium]|nr:glycoside hydrolase family 2 TIM barrel-domain containing protein [Caulobacteraceae bacterium]